MRLLVLCTCHEVVSNLPQGCVPQNYAILLIAYLLSLRYLVALHCTLNLNSGIVTLRVIYNMKCYLNPRWHFSDDRFAFEIMHVLRFGNRLNEVLCCRFIFTNHEQSLDL